MMTMTQEEREAAIQRASGYREMMKGWAWKDFEKILDAIRLNALEGADESGTDSGCNNSTFRFATRCCWRDADGLVL